ncbi:MAG: DUF1871 family protein [Planctomycetaceae bacterium]|jgi:hypothetical protein|nr:DUF1871 family protein [Planctomycetaceae bacterium]MBT6153914.1 DUF1871 family protein [Planctomycetaceae bacterium]MBT6486615.1 DUF1871 family protein [Planctomycetaceae bacterium]MBT6498170.1 DUF1871 family protein [Planctomycetaceae bacterium]
MSLLSRKDYDKAIKVVTGVIHRWDPYGLLAGGAPQEEFDSEIQSLVAQIPRIDSKTDAAHAVSRIFSSAFEAETFTVKKCRDVGNGLHAALVAAGIIEA